MDYLWSPWRFRYVSEAAKIDRCVFCDKAAAERAQDRENLVLGRFRHNFVILNLYPYTTGHAMVAPYVHLANLSDLDSETLAEMMALAQKLEGALRSTYQPEGFNLGMNLGKCAGDSNFMTVVAETRVHPEDLLATYDKLVGFFRD